jgi:hypothetical protein
MIIPSILTAGPNFRGHVFFDGIQKNWLYLQEPFLQNNSWEHPIISIPPEHQYCNYKRFWYISASMRDPSITAVNPPIPCPILFAGPGIYDWDVVFIRCARIRTGGYYDKRIFETRGQGDTGRLHYPVHLSLMPYGKCDNQ